ncbi:glucan -beta-glucosidase protein [Apiospora hydei]|uniref:Glucan -beta-glucosidase protein n=1 Tax=Apiospora hydei TaxID=1337664 RepID=A0ABR1XB02_9PEZI
MARGPVQCHRPADFPGHADIAAEDQQNFSVDFSGQSHSGLKPGSKPIYMKASGTHDISYEYEARWIDGCETTVPSQSFQSPLGEGNGDITAYLLVREDFTKCNNGGIGGWTQVGCLKYTFWGGR